MAPTKDRCDSRRPHTNIANRNGDSGGTPEPDNADDDAFSTAIKRDDSPTTELGALSGGSQVKSLASTSDGIEALVFDGS